MEMMSRFSSEKSSVMSRPFRSSICDGRAGLYSPTASEFLMLLVAANIRPIDMPTPMVRKIVITKKTSEKIR